MGREAWDVVIIGGGPAGSTLGALLKKYNPGKRILILERAKFPRYHIGESLLIGVVPLLKELGVVEKIERAGFVKKLGATYVWGKTRKVWKADFSDALPARLLKEGDDSGLKYSWHVRRSEYDRILLEHAASLGVEVRHGWAASDIIEEDGRVVGLGATDPGGRPVRLSCGTLADCSGQAGFMARYRKVRRYDPRLGNVALHAYFKGARFRVKYTGHPDKTNIFVCSTDCGWFWYIPVGEDVVSVGLVTHQRFLKDRAIKDLKEFFLTTLRGCRELSGLVKNARMMDDFSGDGRDFFVVKDWSYLNVSSCGPGWLAAGDASVFVDPILSSGVLLAHMAGHRAACALTTIWRRGGSLTEEMIWSDYNEHYRHAAQLFLATALFWYGNDRDAGQWWTMTRGLVRSAMPLPLKSKQAFVVIAAGVQDYYERLYQAEHLFVERHKSPDSYPLFEAGDWGRGEVAKAELSPEDAFELLCPFEAGYALVPERGTGLLRPLRRVKFLRHAEESALDGSLNPVRLVLPFHLDVLEWVKEGSTLAEISRRLAAPGKMPPVIVARAAAKFLSDLIMLGVLVVRKMEKQEVSC